MGTLRTMQYEDGTWVMAMPGGGAIYVWCTSNGTNELWASNLSGFLPLPSPITATKTNQDLNTPQEFLAWVCTQYPAGTKLNVVQQQSTFTPYGPNGTYQCP